jgi:hypothetical protein
LSSGCDNESNAQQNTQETETLAVDFLQNIISGSVGEKISENEYLFELTLSPKTVFTADMPRRKAGSITTEKFYDNFDINFPESFPNAILAINEGATPSGVPFEMRNPVYNPSTGVLEVIISPLETTSDAGEGSVNLIDIEDILSPFGQNSLFIDDVTNTCSGLVIGMCSMGKSGRVDPNTCAIDGECLDAGATCVGGSPGVCSVTGEDCVSDDCGTSGLDGCLDSPLDINL